MAFPTRLSESIIWQWQRNYFAAQGTQAFASRTVPDLITNSAFIARAYARIICAWLKDYALAFKPPEGTVITLLEAGAGSGRLAYRILRALEEEPGYVNGKLRLRYVLSDFDEKFIGFWLGHALLRPFLEAGKLDLAVYDAASDTPLRLVQSGELIGPGTLETPLLVIGNYFFDSLPHDVFEVRPGQLLQGLVRAEGLTGTADGSQGLDGLRTDFEFSPATLPYYEDALQDALLEHYTNTLGDGNFSMPVGGWKALDYFASLSQQGCFMLAADKGPNLPESLRTGKHTVLSRHGAVAASVNFHAIARWIEAKGGKVLQQAHPYHRLNVLAFQWGSAVPAGQWLAKAFEEEFLRFGPDDLQNLSDALLREDAGLLELFSLLRLADWDPDLLMAHAKRLLRVIPESDRSVQKSVLAGLERAFGHHYQMGEPEDLPFTLGAMCIAMEDWRPALRFFVASVQEKGKLAHNTFYTALTLTELGEWPEAERWLQAAEAAGAKETQLASLRQKLDSVS